MVRVTYTYDHYGDEKRGEGILLGFATQGAPHFISPTIVGMICKTFGGDIFPVAVHRIRVIGDSL